MSSDAHDLSTLESRESSNARTMSRFSWTVVGLLVASIVLWTIFAIYFVQRTKTVLPLDFQVYRDAASSMLHGGAVYQERFAFANLNFTYPPFALLLFSVLTVTTPSIVLAVWSFLSCVALVVFVALALSSLTTLSRRHLILVSLVISGASCRVLEPIRSNMSFGQINVFLMLAIFADVVVIRSRFRGVLTGLAAAVKLTPLLYIAYFFIVRSRSSVLRAIGTFVAASGVAWLILSSDSALFWFHQAFVPGHKGGSLGWANQSWLGLVGHFSSTLGRSTVVALWLVLSAVTFLLGLYLARRYLSSARPVEALLALALTELLISPISWTHHWSWIVLLPVILFAQWRRDRWVSAAMLLLLVVAITTPYKWHDMTFHLGNTLRVVPAYSLLLSGVLLMITMAGTEWRRSKRESDVPSATSTASTPTTSA